MLAPVISRQKKSIWNMVVEKLRNKTQTLKNLDENLKKIQSSQIFKPPPKWVFTKSINHRAMKLGTHTQVPNSNTPAKFQGHPHIITPFTTHMCSIQGH